MVTATAVGPDFIGIGAQKSATTWATDVLVQHPSVLIRRKEVNFFVRHFHRGYDWYHRWFEDRGGCMAGEVTPNYLISPRRNRASKQFYPKWMPRGELFFWRRNPSARDEIARHFPNARIFAIFRDPTSRAWSHYQMWRRRRERNSKRIVEFRQMFADDGRWMRSTGYYADHLAYWREAFPDMGVFLFDDLKDDPIAFAKSIYGYIGVDETFTPEIDTTRKAREYAPLPVADRAALIEEYREQIVRFSGMIGRDLSHWLDAEPKRSRDDDAATATQS